MHLRSSSLRLRKVRQTEVEGLEAPCPATPSSCCSFAQLEARNAIQPRRRLGISFFQTKGQETTSCQHASVRLSSTCCRQNRNSRPTSSIRVPHVPAYAGIGSCGEQLRPETRPRTAPPFQHQNDPRRLCPSDHPSEARSAGHVPNRAPKGDVDGEGTCNKTRYIAAARILWAYCGLTPIDEFRISALECGGQGRS